jgi:hypothetical protein
MSTHRFPTVVLAVLLASIATLAAQQGGPGEGNGNVTPAYCYEKTGTINTTMKYCVSPHGNIVNLQSPVSTDHIATATIAEGYVLCSGTTVLNYDIGFREKGWKPGSIVVNSSRTGLTLRRVTTDGRWQLDQEFGMDGKENDITVKMTLTNFVQGAFNVRLARVVDFDMDHRTGGPFSGASTVIFMTERGVAAYYTHALTLSNITFSQPVKRATGENDGTFQPACPASGVAEVPVSYDTLSYVTASLGSMSPGTSVETTFVYRRQ